MARTWSADPDCLEAFDLGVALGNGPRTVSIWGFRTSDTGLGRYFQVSDFAGAFVWALFTSGAVEGHINYETDGIRRNVRPALSEWHHVACVADYPASWDASALVDIYVNGSIAGQTTNQVGSGAAESTGDLGELHIGNNNAHSRSWAGRLAEVAVWSVQLSAAEIADLSAGVNPLDIQRDALEMYVPIYGDNDPEPDASGNGRSLSIVGTLPQSAHPTIDPPTSSGPFDDDFTGTDGEPWNQELWDQDAGAGGGSTVIDTNQGKASGSTGNANSGGRGRGKQGQVPNQEMTGTFQLCETGEPCNGALWLQTSDDWSGLDFPTEGYGVRLPSDSDTATLLLASGGVLTQLDSAIWPRDTGLKQFRFRRQSNKVRFRIWDDGDPEPEGWLLTADDSTITPDAAGAFQIGYTCPSAPSVDACATYDTLAVDENDTPIPDSNGNGGNGDDRIGGTGAIRRSAAAVRRGRRG